MVKRITHRQREKAWRMYKTEDAISTIAKKIHVSYSAAWGLTEGRKQGYKNYSEYLEHWAQQKGYKNRSEYQEHLAQQRQQNPENKELSDLIKSRLAELGKNQNWLAEQMGVTRQAVSLYVHGKIIPNSEKLEQLFTALKVTKRPKSLDELIERE